VRSMALSQVEPVLDGSQKHCTLLTVVSRMDKHSEHKDKSSAPAWLMSVRGPRTPSLDVIGALLDLALHLLFQLLWTANTMAKSCPEIVDLHSTSIAASSIAASLR